MDNRVALIGIMVENPDSIETMNRILHEYGQYIILSDGWDCLTGSAVFLLSALFSTRL